MSMIFQQTFTAEQKTTIILPDLSYTSFVVKAQKAKTRKGKDYFVLRVTIPKEIAQKIDARPNDHLLIRAKKAQWFDMVNWPEMEATWNMLPSNIKHSVIFAGLPNPDLPKLLTAMSSQGTNLSQLSAPTGVDPSMQQTLQPIHP